MANRRMVFQSLRQGLDFAGVHDRVREANGFPPKPTAQRSTKAAIYSAWNGIWRLLCRGNSALSRWVTCIAPHGNHERK